MQKIGIIGYGEIGSSLEKCYLGKNFDVRIRDIVRDDGLENCDFLNICIPYKDIIYRYCNLLYKKLKPFNYYYTFNRNTWHHFKNY